MTAKELAKLLGVSPATVSLVVNNKAGVSHQTRKRVLSGIQSLGIDASKQKLYRDLLLIIYRKHGISPHATPFFSSIYSEIIESIGEQAKRRGCTLSVSYMDEHNFNTQYQEIKGTDAAGIIILATELTKEQEETLQFPVPVVLLDNFIPKSNRDCITMDNAQGVRIAVEYLHEKGHTQIGYVHVEHNATNFQERKEGFYAAMEEAGLPINPHFIFTVSTSQGGEKAKQMLTDEIMDSDAFPTAFFTDNDILASYMIAALKQKGLSVPQDISVVGFDNMNFASFMQPPLTTIDIPKALMGTLAVDTLCESVLFINTAYLGLRRIQLLPRLIERASVKEIT
jgi:LacI family transcriptional regulator